MKYDAVFSDLEHEGIIQEVPEDELDGPYNIWYLPHHPVVKESRLTTKVRPVFDASAKGKNGISLNDCVYTGPSLIPNLVEILIRFRKWPVALSADITKAFLQVGVRREDQDVHRFFWMHGNRLRTMRFTRVPFGNRCSPFLLNATIRHHLASYPDSNKTVVELRDNLYVDDWLSGANSEEEACKMFAEARNIMLQAGMSLAKWSSNSSVVTDEFYREFESKHIDTEAIKVLGIKWNSYLDCFMFDGLLVPTDVVVTKRLVLSYIARLFDPLGFLTPFVMYVKIIFQDCWKLGLEWDTELPRHLQDRFVKWVSGIPSLQGWKIPRRYTSVTISQVQCIQLHAFGDASERGYGAVVFIRVPSGVGTYDVSLVASKGKVAPVKTVTLPRLELLGALLAARLLCFVQKALKLDTEVKTFCWTDSTIALAWIQGDSTRWKPFVANRVVEIQQLTNPSDWHHCTSSDNPADLVSRGCTAEQLIQSSLWLNGPPWLSDKLSFVSDCVSEVDPALDAEELSSSCIAAEPAPLKLFDVERWGSFTKAIRIVSWIYRFIHNAKLTRANRISGELSFSEMSSAKHMLFRQCQLDYYAHEMYLLSQGKQIPRSSSILKLRPFIGKDGLLRVHSRLQLSALSYDEVHPIILPKCHLAKLIIRFQHIILKHCGVSTLVSSLRNTYWIVGLRRLAKTVKRECISCQRFDAISCNEPVAPLPGLRVQQAPAFSVIGLDFAGPLFCSDNPRQKHYVLLFTCAVIRAVHLELTDSMSTDEFLLAFRRFSARRGLPSTIYSDNAKSFKSAQHKLSVYLGPQLIEWKYIVPRSPWWGGWWERLVRSVKSALRKSVGMRCLSKSELYTILSEIESCINSRPITFVGDEPYSPEPLSPSHFLIGKSTIFQSSVDLDDSQMVTTRKDLSARELVYRQRLEVFWDTWSKDYLRSLPSAVKKFYQQGKLKEGAVVLIREDNMSRCRWPMGVVVELYPGRDGIARSAKIKTSKGVLIRPIQRLHDLEVCEGTDLNLNDNTSNPGVTVSRYERRDPGVTVARYERRDPGVTVSRYGRRIKPVDRLDL